MGNETDAFLEQLKRLREKATEEKSSESVDDEGSVASNATLSSDPEIEAMKKQIAKDPKLQERLAALEKMIEKKLRGDK